MDHRSVLFNGEQELVKREAESSFPHGTKYGTKYGTNIETVC
jgi:hypothetical protein